MRTFKIFPANNSYILVAVTPNGARTTAYKYYPINVINILKNIGYAEQDGI